MIPRRVALGSQTRRLLPALSSLKEGYGSAYERYAVGVLLELLCTRLGVRTLAEWPANGVLGVPGLKSLPVAFLGVEVTLLSPSRALLDGATSAWRAVGAEPAMLLVGSPEDPHAAAAGAFDLVWSFCAFEHAKSPSRLAEAMCRVSRGHVLVFVQNAKMPGVHLHRMQHERAGEPWDHGALTSMHAEFVADRLEAAGARVVELGGCDLPPWPDLDVRLPRPFEERRAPSPPGARPYGPSDPALSPAEAASVLGSTRGPLSPAMQVLAAWHDLVEASLPRAFLRLAAHHPYVLARCG
ncbi:MAG TPA: methyltransferase domain-containing protein [Polyangiaceae bacterium]|nr:methyltransferase domain-containing protein [Polyangiaceae bacterium]